MDLFVRTVRNCGRLRLWSRNQHSWRNSRLFLSGGLVSAHSRHSLCVAWLFSIAWRHLRCEGDEANACHLIHVSNFALSSAGALCLEAITVAPECRRITPGNLGLS